MKFGISKQCEVTKTNIDGKLLKKYEKWYVYRSFFFGLFRAYIRIHPIGFDLASEVKVEYCARVIATDFSTREECERLIADMLNNPDKYVRYK